MSRGGRASLHACARPCDGQILGGALRHILSTFVCVVDGLNVDDYCYNYSIVERSQEREAVNFVAAMRPRAVTREVWPREI